MPCLLRAAEPEPQPAFPKQPLDWEEDAQLRSWLLDRKVRGGPWGGVGVAGPPPEPPRGWEKRHGDGGRGCPPCPPPLQEELRASHGSYARQHPELAALLAHFLQALLLRQPPDPLPFAAAFFAPFARRQPPGPRFASSRSPQAPAPQD